MADTMSLAQIVDVSPRFARSVSLLKDWDREDSLEGYILTPRGRSVLGQLVESIAGESPTRAWTLTGPYGTGKSAFASLQHKSCADTAVSTNVRELCCAKRIRLFGGAYSRAGLRLRKGGSLFRSL